MYKESKEFLGVIMNFGEFDGNIMQKRVHITKDWVGCPKKVLDVGCSGGWLPKFYFSDDETRVWGITNNDAELAAMPKQRITPVTFDFNGKKKLPFKSGSFDLVLLGEVIEHMLYPKSFMEEVHRVLKPNGKVVGSTPNSFHLWGRLNFLLGRRPPVFSFEEHIRLFGKRDVLDLLKPRFKEARVAFCTDRIKVPALGSMLATYMVFRAVRR